MNWKRYWLQRINFETEKKGFQTERKSFDLKSAKKKISELELLVKNEKRKCAEKDFMSEMKYFETEIKKLSRKLSGPSSDIMKERILKSDLQKTLSKAIG